MPWFPEAMPDGKLAKAFVDEWAKRGHPFEGLTEGFRGHDGIATIAEAIKIAGKDEPKAIQAALWKVSFTGVNGPIKFEKDGPAGKESGQSEASHLRRPDQGRQGRAAGLPREEVARSSGLDQLLQHLVNGLVLGGTYALLGIGLTLIFGLMNVVNFAHGEFYTLGAYLPSPALALAGLNFFVALAARHRAGRGGGRRLRASSARAAARPVDRHHHAGHDRALDRACRTASCSVGAAWPSPSPPRSPPRPSRWGR